MVLFYRNIISDLQQFRFVHLNKDQLDYVKKLSQDDNKEREENKVKFCCEMCDKQINTSLEFALHSIAHSDKYHCQYCSFKTRVERNMKKHLATHGNGASLPKCEVCLRVFSESVQAEEHKNFHSGELPYHCTTCDKHFMFSWLLHTHVRLYHCDVRNQDDTYTCGLCKNTFGTKSGLRKHAMRKHEPKIPSLCDICGKSLSSAETLKFHKRTHTGYKPHTCSTCGKSFSKKGLLVEHERVHTGEKPFTCRFCGKGFSQRGPLKIHLRIHTGERPYVCRLCGKGCICKSVLDAHLRTCTGVVY